jgi:hypothetical protein
VDAIRECVRQPVEAHGKQERRANMNEDILKGKWKEIKGGVKKKWGKLTENMAG